MSEDAAAEVGSITWQDLTVDDAEGISAFYSAVVGWKREAVDMGGYEDFNMLSPTSGEVRAGICHARGANLGIPPQWLIYITVADLDASISECIRLGGAVVGEPRNMGDSRYAVIRDPQGAVCTLFQV